MIITNEIILLIIFIQFCFVMYQISKISNICNEAFETVVNTDIEKQIATFYQADIASIQALGNVAKALITGGNIVPGNLTINGNLVAPKIINTPTFTNGLGLPIGQKINLQSNISGNNVADTISTGTFDATALCIVGHGTGSGNESGTRNIHLWDNVLVDKDLTVKGNLVSSGNTINGNSKINGNVNISGRLQVYTPFIYVDSSSTTHIADQYGINQIIILRGGTLRLPHASSCAGQVLFLISWMNNNTNVIFNNGNDRTITVQPYQLNILTNDGTNWLSTYGKNW
jgi:hypothetical protein